MENVQDVNKTEILIVEDSPGDVEYTLWAFKRKGLVDNIYVVKDGEEALEFIFCTGRYAQRDISMPPKVILLDLNLPKVSGLDVLKKIKEDDRTKTIPVVIVTVSQENNDLKESYKLGVNSFIVKPVSFESFFKAVGEAGVYWTSLNQTLKQ